MNTAWWWGGGRFYTNRLVYEFIQLPLSREFSVSLMPNCDLGFVCVERELLGMPRTLTLVGTVGMGLVAVVPTVVIPIASPVYRNAAPAVAFELVAGAGMAAAGFVTVVPTVVVWNWEEEEKRSEMAKPVGTEVATLRGSLSHSVGGGG